MTTYHYLSVAEWGGTWKRPPVAERLNDPEAFVHHSAGSVHVNDDMSGRELAILHMQRANAYAQISRDYSFIGYDNYVIDLFLFGGPDEVWICEARGRHMSAATRNRNEQGEAVCVAGMFHPGVSYSVRPRDATFRGAAKAIVKQINEGRTAPDADILGHRQNPSHPGATVCPGDWFFPHMPTVEQYVADELAPAPAPKPEPESHPTPNPPTEDDMTAATLWADTRYKNVFLIGAGSVVTCSPDVFDSLKARGVPFVHERHDQMLRDVCAHLGINRSDLVPA